MRCTDTNTDSAWSFWASWRGWAVMAALGGSAGWLGGCAIGTPTPTAPVRSAAPVARAADAAPAVPMAAARNWNEYKLRAAKRLVAANPTMTYLGEVPEALLAIPVLEVELKADGSVAHIAVLRKPSQAFDTTQLAIDAVHRAAPFGDVSHLPKPWRYTEAFLFDDDRRFKPRSLD